jgi:hypothetical protein
MSGFILTCPWHPMSRYACNQCGKGFVNAQALGSHARWCKGPGHVARTCTNCGMDLAAHGPKGRTNHDRGCRGTQATEAPPLDASSDESIMDDGSSDDPDTADEGVTVLECHQALADAGTLDPLFLVRLMNN